MSYEDMWKMSKTQTYVCLSNNTMVCTEEVCGITKNNARSNKTIIVFKNGVQLEVDMKSEVVVRKFFDSLNAENKKRATE